MPNSIDWDSEFGLHNRFRGFTEWVHWDSRGALTHQDCSERIVDYPGVYLLAHFDSVPVGPASHLDPAIIYIGEATCLRKRWNQFEKSAFIGVDGHSGGLS